MGREGERIQTVGCKGTENSNPEIKFFAHIIFSHIFKHYFQYRNKLAAQITTFIPIIMKSTDLMISLPNTDGLSDVKITSLSYHIPVTNFTQAYCR